MKEIKFSNSKEKVANFLRLAHKAGSVSLGRKLVNKNISTNKSSMIFSGKKGDKSIKKNEKIIKKNKIPVYYLFSDEELAYVFGRNKLTLVSIDDKNFANGLKAEIGKFKDKNG